MKRAVLSLLAIATVGAQAQTFVDEARVRQVQPQYETVQVPREVCTSHWVNEVQPSGPSYGGAAIGAVAGGVLGNQVGKGSGRDAATAAGVVIGALAGNQIGSRNQPAQVAQREVRQCHTVMEQQQRAAGYRVTYEYRGHEHTTVLPQDPGRTLPVRVSVAPEPGYHRR